MALGCKKGPRLARMHECCLWCGRLSLGLHRMRSLSCCVQPLAPNVAVGCLLSGCRKTLCSREASACARMYEYTCALPHTEMSNFAESVLPALLGADVHHLSSSSRCRLGPRLVSFPPFSVLTSGSIRTYLRGGLNSLTVPVPTDCALAFRIERCHYATPSLHALLRVRLRGAIGINTVLHPLILLQNYFLSLRHIPSSRRVAAPSSSLASN